VSELSIYLLIINQSIIFMRHPVYALPQKLREKRHLANL